MTARNVSYLHCLSFIPYKNGGDSNPDLISIQSRRLYNDGGEFR